MAMNGGRAQQVVMREQITQHEAGSSAFRFLNMVSGVWNRSGRDSVLPRLNVAPRRTPPGPPGRMPTPLGLPDILGGFMSVRSVVGGRGYGVDHEKGLSSSLCWDIDVRLQTVGGLDSVIAVEGVVRSLCGVFFLDISFVRCQKF